MFNRHLTPEERALRAYHATRMVNVKFVQSKYNGAVPILDNQWLYKKQRKSGKTPEYWENYLKNLVMEWHQKGKVLEASLHDLSGTDTGMATGQNKIMQLVSNGHILF